MNHVPDAWIERNEDDPGDPYFRGGEPEEVEQDDDPRPFMSRRDFNRYCENELPAKIKAELKTK